MQSRWRRLEYGDAPTAFPRDPTPLAALHVPGGSDVLLTVGGSSSSTSRVKEGHGLAAQDFEELLVGGGEVATDCWSAPLSGVVGFERSVLAFPPKPRFGYSLTPLDQGGGRLLLFGGHTGRPGSGRCLSDLHVIELPEKSAPSKDVERRPDPDSGTESEEEDIFFASNYRAACGSAVTAATLLSTEAAAARSKRRGCSESGFRAGFEAESSDDENDETARSAVPKRALPCTTEDVLAKMGSTQVTMTRRTGKSQEAATSSDRPGGTSPFEGARWRQPQALETTASPRPRAGHSAVLQVPIAPGETPAVLIYGGLGDGGLPLSDAFEVRILETEDLSLEYVWSLLDAGGKEHCETAPWEQQKAPRPRTCHSAVFWPSSSQRSMVVFGGLGMGLEGEPKALGDTWLLMVGSTTPGRGLPQVQATAGWKRPMMTGGAPPCRFGHGACLVNGDDSRMLVAGGLDASGSPLADCWLLHLKDLRWECVAEGITPVPRPLSSFAEQGDTAPKELGRCHAVWSVSEKAVIIWSCHGFWAWQEADQTKLHLRGGKSEKALQPVSPRKRPSGVTPALADKLISEEWKRAGDTERTFSKGGLSFLAPVADPKAKASRAEEPGETAPRDLPSVLPPRRRPPAGTSWKDGPGSDASDTAFQQSWPQHKAKRADSEKRSVASATGRERKHSSSHKQIRPLGPVLPPARQERAAQG